VQAPCDDVGGCVKTVPYCCLRCRAGNEWISRGRTANKCLRCHADNAWIVEEKVAKPKLRKATKRPHAKQ